MSDLPSHLPRRPDDKFTGALAPVNAESLSINSAEPLSVSSGRLIKAALSGLSNNSCRVYRRHLDAFMAWLKVTNLQLTREVVSGYLDAHYGHDPSNFNQALSAVKRLANQAAHNGWLDWQIAHSIDTIKSKVVRGARAGNWLSLPQAKRLLNAPGTISVSGKRDKAVLALLLGCGIRREELSEALVKQFAEREGRYYLLDLHGKGGRIRTVAVPPWAVEVVLEWLAVYAAKENAPLVCSFLFNGGFRGKLSVSAIWDIVSHWSKRTGVPIAPHDLRRTYSRLARDQGAPIEVIQKSLGHSNIATTQRYLGATDQANAGDWFEV